MEEIEDFKYEFDLSFDIIYGTHKSVPMVLFDGYVCLHQFVKNNLEYVLGKLNMYQMFDELLEKDEYIVEINGEYNLLINNLNEVNLEYIKFLLNCCLISPKELRLEDNIIKWRIDNENY